MSKSAIITRTPHERQSWQQQLSDLITDPAELLDCLQLQLGQLDDALRAAMAFPLRVPRGFVGRMRIGDPHDPLLRQVLPVAEELLASPGYSDDPLAEAQHNPVPGLIHKYHGRVLLVVTSACAIHCRYCFRREFDYNSNRQSSSQWQAGFDYIAAHDDIREVILSGGDPLAASDTMLQRLCERLADIPHVDTLRIHTRLPVVIPDRIETRPLPWLDRQRFRSVVVVHANHARELDHATSQAFARLRDSGLHLLNQSVLLSGVNDNTEALEALSRELFKQQVMPYYLHLPDRTTGTAHFAVSAAEAKQIHDSLAKRVPGYLLPKLVYEKPGAASKLPVC